MQLQPTEQFVISRQLGPTDDTDTHYVRSKVRNAKTDVLLATVPLADKGSRRFTAVYEVPQDISGLGFYITITTSVYTDALFTTLDPNYQEVAETYLVQDRPNRLGPGGGGGGADIDYDKIEQLIEAAISSMENEEPVDLSPVLIGLSKIAEKIGKLPTSIPQVKVTEVKFDTAPLLKALEALGKQIDSLPKEVPETDFSGLHDSFSALSHMVGKSIGSIGSTLENMDGKLEEFGSKVEALKTRSVDITISPKLPEEPPKGRKPFVNPF